MDFRNCPACKASVLEDDAEDCPFCGASMSGKPSSKPVAPKAAAQPKAAAASAKPHASQGASGTKSASTTGAKTRPSPEELDDGSDPFEVDTRAVVKAPAVSPKPAKGRMTRVLCPMCETPGFITPQLQGKEVKCCNPQCLMPIFTAPKAKEAPVEEAPQRSLASTVFAVVAVVLVLGVGAALYHFVIKEDGAGKPSGTAGGPKLAPTVTNNGTGSVLVAESSKGPVEPQTISPDEIRTTSLADVEKAAQKQQNNRSKPYGRRMAAEAFADAGQFDEAREQLADMQKVQGYLPYIEVEPLVLIAEGLAAKGDVAGAKAALDDALAKADFPEHGRDPLDAVSRLATALVVAGRNDEARRVAPLADDAGTRGRAFVLWRDALDSGSLDLNAPANRPYLFDMPSAQWVSITQALLSQRHASEALAWAMSAENPAVRDNALAAWAGGVARAEPATDGNPAPAQVSEALAGLTPIGQARVWAAVADARHSQGNAAAATECLDRATAALDQAPLPAPLPLPSLKAIHDTDGQPRAGLPDPTESRSAALAAADIAQVRAATGDPAAAWTALSRSLAFLRGTTPSPVATQALIDECESNRSAVESQLQSALGVEGNRVFLAFNKYRKQCGVLHEEAAQRFDLQVRLMRRAAAFGVLQPVWDEAVAREQHSDPAAREQYFDTLLPGTVLAYAAAAKNEALVGQIQQAIPARELRIDARDQLVIAIGPRIDAEDIQRAADLLRAYDLQEPGDYYTSQTMALRGVSKLIAAGKYQTAMDLAVAAIDPLLREDAVQLIAAAAVRDNQHSELWRKRMEFGLSATELASFYRGCMRGLALRPATTEAAPETASR